MNDTMFVGIDLGSCQNMVCIMSQDAKSVSRFPIPNDPSGVALLCNRLVSTAQTKNVRSFRIGMEATNLYWWHLYHALYDEPALSGLKLQVDVINPKVIDGFKRVYVDMPKSDRTDASVIADCLRFGRVKPSPPPDLRYAPLQRLTRYRFALSKTITAEKNRALNLVFLKFSNYASACPFSNPFGKASQAVLETMTPDEINQMPLADLASLVSSNGKNRFKDASVIAQQLKTISRNAYRLSPKMRGTVDVALAMSLEILRFFESQLNKLDLVIATELKAIPQTIDTIPGIGAVYSAGITAEIGDVSRFAGDDQLAKFAGLTWREFQSSKFDADDKPLTRSGNYYLRYYLVEAANSVRVREPEYAAFYRKKFEQSTHHHHKRALVLTARKLLRLVFALLSKGQVYRPEEVSQN